MVNLYGVNEKTLFFLGVILYLNEYKRNLLINLARENINMVRIRLNKSLISIFIFPIVYSLSNVAIAATEVKPALGVPTTYNLLVSGDDAALTGQGAEVTLNVLNGFNLGISGGGDSVTSQAAPNIGKVTFSGNSTVAGRIGGGVNSQVFDDISGGAAGTIVRFNGPIESTTITFTNASTMVFNANTSAAMHFGNTNGTAIIGPGVTYTGAATQTRAGVGTGNITLNTGSIYTGAVGNLPNFINNITLNGNASINGAVSSFSTVLGPNTLTQAGAVNFPSGASITVRAVSDNAYGRINAPGQAISFSSPLTVHMLVDNTTILSGVPLQVITGAGAGGTPILTTSNNVRFSFRGQNPLGTGNVLIFPTVIPAVLPAGAAGAAAAASAFDAAALGATGDFLFVQQQVTALNDLAAIGAAQAQFAPIANGGPAAMSFQAAGQFQNLWQNNLVRARAANMCSPICGPSDCLEPCHSECDPRSRKEAAWNGEGLWIDGFGDFANQTTRMDIAGYTAKMYGGMIGMQKPISTHWELGLGGGYAYTDIDGKGIQSNGTKIHTTDATIYLGYNCGPWFLDNFLSTAWNHYTGFRNIQFPGLSRTANADYYGREYSALFSTGYNFYYGTGLTVTPLASLEFSKLNIDAYTETGANSLDLIEKGQKYNLVQSSLGLSAGYPLMYDCGTLWAEVHSNWIYDIHQYQINKTSTFSGGGPSFNTVGVTPARNQVNVGVSATFYTAGNLSLIASYDFNYRKNFISNVGKAIVSLKF